MNTRALITCAAAVCAATGLATAADWPMWGGTPSRNMVSAEKGIAHSFDPGRLKRGTEEVDPATTRNIKWVAKLGSQSYGNPVVSGGKVFIGTNNESSRDPQHKGDRGNLYCFDEQTGEFRWQLVVPKLGAGKVSDWEYLGICSSPAVDGDRLYVVTNRCEVVCLDVNGMADGNQGFQDEAKYMAEAGVDPASIVVGAKDADILWVFDMRDELGVFPHNIASNSAMVVGDVVYVATSNGQDWSHVNIPAPNAPALIGLNKMTGELVVEEASGISRNSMHSNWSSPAYLESGDGPGQIIFGAGDGFCYGFDTTPQADDEGFMVFKELWRFDANPPSYRTDDSGQPRRYTAYEGPSEIISTPVVHKNRVYVSIGQDPEHGEGIGALQCIDATGRGDISKSGAIWTYTDLHRSISTVAIAENLVYAADYTGRVHCIDADTGKAYWVHDTQSHIWGSPLVVDGKVYVGNEDGELTIFRAGKELEVIDTIDFDGPIYGTPVAANGVLYVNTHTHLFAIESK